MMFISVSVLGLLLPLATGRESQTHLLRKRLDDTASSQYGDAIIGHEGVADGAGNSAVRENGQGRVDVLDVERSLDGNGTFASQDLETGESQDNGSNATTSDNDATDTYTSEDEQGGKGASKGPVHRHTIYLKFADKTSADEKSALVGDIVNLPRHVPEIIQLQWGIDTSKPLGELNDGFHYAFIATTEEDDTNASNALQAYIANLTDAYGSSVEWFTFDYVGEDPTSLVKPELKHAVYIDFKSGLTASILQKLGGMEAFEEAVEELASNLDEIKGLEWGERINEENTNPGDFTHVFMLTFESRPDFLKYTSNAAAVALFNTGLGSQSIVEDIRIIHFWDLNQMGAYESNDDECGEIPKGTSCTMEYFPLDCGDNYDCYFTNTCWARAAGYNETECSPTNSFTDN